MKPTQTISRDNLWTGSERSMRYHQARTQFFNGLHLFIQFIVFAIASASVFRLIESFLPDEQTLPWLWAVVSLLALFSLVYNPAEKASLHKSLYRGFAMLAGEIAATLDPDEATLSEWTKRIHGLYADEPPVYRALLAHCDNQITIALNADKGCFVDLRWYHRLLRNLIPFQGTAFSNRNQAHHQ